MQGALNAIMATRRNCSTSSNGQYNDIQNARFNQTQGRVHDQPAYVAYSCCVDLHAVAMQHSAVHTTVASHAATWRLIADEKQNLWPQHRHCRTV
jgi:hypothetical protein